MVVTNVVLVSKLLSLPPEEREELLGLLEDPESRSFEETEKAILKRLSGTASDSGPRGKD
ncbi:MAG: hypothetical protein OEM24_02490 [Paracoccaceae bacterium]|nr:hypothetical protein [Paracoccaceae bacterium]